MTHIRFPQGNGGWWLRHLIHCLKSNCYIKNNDINYHKYNYSMSISHSLLPVTSTDIVFGGTYYFNMFANYAKKTNFELVSVVSDEYTANVCQASYLLEFQHVSSNLLSDSIYKQNANNFRDSLFDTLDNLNIKHHKNNQICQLMFDEYKSKLADPLELFNNWSNIYWIYWSLGVTKKELGDFPVNSPIDVLVDWLKPHKNFILDYTEQRMYKSNT